MSAYIELKCDSCFDHDGTGTAFRATFQVGKPGPAQLFALRKSAAKHGWTKWGRGDECERCTTLRALRKSEGT